MARIKRTESGTAVADEAQRRAIREDLDTTILVEAAAGTGKTRSLIERMVALVATGKTTVDRLCAVTFTIRAAAQLKQRFQSALEYALREEKHSGRRERLAAGLKAIDLCFVGTIHAFAARLLRERPVEAGIEPGFSEMDEPENGAERKEAWNRFVERLFVQGDPRLARLIALGIRPDDLSECFEEVCENSDVEPAAAAPGREPDFSLAREEVAAFLKNAEATIPATAPPGGWDPFQEAVRRAMRLSELLDTRCAPDFVELLRVLRPSAVRDAAGGWKKAIDRLRDQTVKPSLARWAEYVYPDVMPLLMEARDEFAAWRRAHGKANFQDLLLEARDLLRDHPSVRAALFQRFTPILVDEFQDTDPIQAEILFYLTGMNQEERDWKRLVPAPGSLFVVGDPKQSIYRFRRADIETYQDVRRTIERCGRLSRLSTNFRSTPILCEWVNATFSRREFFGEGPTSAQAEYVPLVPSRRDESASSVLRLETPAAGNADQPVVDADCSRIADFIAASIARGERRPEDFLILFRRRRFMADYARALEKRGVGTDLGGGSAFGESQDLSWLMPILRVLADPDDPIPLVAALRGSVFGVDDDALYKFSCSGGRFHFRSELDEKADPRLRSAFEHLRFGEELCRNLPPAAAIARLLERLGLVAHAAAQPLGQSRAGNLEKALAAARKFSAQGLDFPAVVRELDELQHQDSIEQMGLEPGAGRAVRLLTIHGAKGLEAPVVILADPTRDSFKPRDVFIDRSASVPVGYFRVARRLGEHVEKEIARPPQWEVKQAMEKRFDDAERARLLYVAATRAESMLIVSIKRKKGGTASGPWAKLDARLTVGLPEPPSFPPAPVSFPADPPTKDLAAFRTLRAERRARAATPGYTVTSVTAAAHAEEALPAWERTGKGMAWGRVLHGLLEASMKDRSLNLRLFAANLLAEEGRPADELEEALRMVGAVHSSSLWRRAASSRRCLVEVPFALALPRGATEGRGENLLTGAIDLVFEEEDRWVVVDYKSDIVWGNLPSLVQFYRPQIERYRLHWEKLTGKKTSAGLYFIQTGQEVWLE